MRPATMSSGGKKAKTRALASRSFSDPSLTLTLCGSSSFSCDKIASMPWSIFFEESLHLHSRAHSSRPLTGSWKSHEWVLPSIFHHGIAWNCRCLSFGTLLSSPNSEDYSLSLRRASSRRLWRQPRHGIAQFVRQSSLCAHAPLSKNPWYPLSWFLWHDAQIDIQSRQDFYHSLPY